MKRFAISGRVVYAGPHKFTAAAFATPDEPGANADAEVMRDTTHTCEAARLRVFELVVMLASRIRQRGDYVANVEVES